LISDGAVEERMSIPKVLEARNTDIETKDRRKIAALLGEVLTSTYELLLTTQLVHWNVKGETFFSVHKLTDDQYDELFNSLDIIAERMRALGSEVPVDGLNKEFALHAKLSGGDIPQMVEQLAKLHEEAARHARQVAETTEKADDIVTTDMLVDCMKFHEKAVWMLRAIIAK
jgi:starvation-inducible DNA-binding protein